MSPGWDRSALATLLRGSVRLDEPLARHTTYGVGGPAEAFVEPADVADLAACLRFCSARGVPCRVLGEGSNVLVADRGVPGVVVHLGGPAFSFLEASPGPGADGRAVCHLRVGAALPLGRLVALARSEGLAGLVFLAGIPGSAGGAARMNAGTSAGQLADVLESLELVLADGSRQTLAAEHCGLGYRTSRLPAGAVIVACSLRAAYGEPQDVAAAIDRYLARRRATQPAGASAGCVFKNPPGGHAGRLIDQAGLKGLTVGRAQVSRVHANFIVADEGATADDVARLIDQVQQAVAAQHGVALEPENELWGFVGAGEGGG